MKVAIVHDWLTGIRGGEKCLIKFLEIYPEADLFTLIHIKGSTTSEIDRRVKGTSFLQYIPFIKSLYRHFLPLYPLASRSINLSGYDLVISLSHAAAKNVRVEPHALHLCYCFTPMRYIWDQAPIYFGKLGKILAPLLRALQIWDRRGAERVSAFVGISQFVRKRIRQYYQREASVVYPPVEVDKIKVRKEIAPDTAPFICAGALVPYKRIDIAIDAFNQLGLPLVVVGKGPEFSKLKRKAKENIQFFGHVPDNELFEMYRNSQALIFPGVEDFGMVPVEYMASGGPVIALHDGGVAESVAGLCSDLTMATGLLYKSAKDGDEVYELINAVRQFQKIRHQLSPERCRQQAERFSPEVFEASWKNFVSQFGLQRDPNFEQEALANA